jgi:hypothetical protein
VRAEFSKPTKLKAFQRSGGKCEKCTAKLSTGNIEYHHNRECTMGGTAELGNCVVLCATCHDVITGSRAAVIAKSTRQRAKHLGIRKTSKAFPFGKQSRWKKKFSGEIVPR